MPGNDRRDSEREDRSGVSMGDGWLTCVLDLFRARVEEGEELDALLVEVFAVVRETARRVLNMRHFDCQLVREQCP